jgi:hypothetical protein
MTHGEWFALMQIMVAMIVGLHGVKVREQSARRRTSMPWLLIAFFLACMAMLTACDVANRMTPSLREWAQQERLYAARRPLQLAVIVVLLMLIFRTGQALMSNPASHPFAIRMAAAGCLMLLTSWVLRVISFHHTDLIWAIRLLGVSLGRMVEVVALAMILLSAVSQRLLAGEDVDRHV